MNLTQDSTLQGITLTNYDMVVATTQVAINETMGEYLYAHPQDFTILGIVDDNGNVTSITTDPSQAACSLSGTIQLEKDSTGKYINLVDLTTQKGNQTVQYNITMQNGDFKYDWQGLSFEKKQDSSAPWIFRMFVELKNDPVSLNDLPTDLQTKLSSLDENIFSIQQLYMDLNTAALNTIDGVTFPGPVQTPAMQILTLYLAQQQASGKPLFGVSVTYTDQNTPPPTLTPTFVDFCVTPYTDNTGKNSNPDLDTLNYLVMVNNNTPPKTPPSSFNFNWVTDEQNMGAMAIREDEFTPFVINELNPLLKTVCPIMYCKADGSKSSPDDAVIQLNTGTDHTFNNTFNAGTGQIASYSYSTNDSSTDNGPWYAPYELTVSGNYSSTTNILLNADTIQLNGSMTANGDSVSTVQGSSWDSEMPNTTWNWSVDLQLYFDAENNGQLDLKIINPNFNTPPTVEDHSQSWWETFLQSLGGYMVSYTNNLGDLVGTVENNIEGSIVTSLTSILATANHFIFPGAKTFAFENPQFSNSRDLVSNITYLNPNA